MINKGLFQYYVNTLVGWRGQAKVLQVITILKGVSRICLTSTKLPNYVECPYTNDKK